MVYMMGSMAAATVDVAPLSRDNISTTQLRLSSGNGPVCRNVLKEPLRDALPTEIPIINVSGIFSASEDDRKGVARQIRDAATNNGFFYIKNHGIPSEVPERACQCLLEFFRQPREIKDRADVKKSKYLNGYKPPKSQRTDLFECLDMRETFSWTYDPNYDPSVPDPSAIPRRIARHLRCEDFHWKATSNLPHFKDAIVQYWRSCLTVARVLGRCFALSLDLPEDLFVEKFTHPDAALALEYYPPLPVHLQTAVEVNTGISIGPHTDFPLFTISWQDENGGLQVLNRQGQWVNAKPIPGTFVVYIENYMQHITNDRYVSTVHRVQNYSGNESISMPFFFGFNRQEIYDVFNSCVGEGEEKKYEEISCNEWVQRRARAMRRKAKHQASN